MLSRGGGGGGVGAWTEIHLEIGNARSWSHLWRCGNVPKYCGQNWLVVGRLLPKQQQQRHYLHRRTNKWAAGWEEPVSAFGHSCCNRLKALVTLHSDQSCQGTPAQPGSTAGTGPRGGEEENGSAFPYIVLQILRRRQENSAPCLLPTKKGLCLAPFCSKRDDWPSSRLPPNAHRGPMFTMPPCFKCQAVKLGWRIAHNIPWQCWEATRYNTAFSAVGVSLENTVLYKTAILVRIILF